jgi:hypothetical protein
VTRTRSSPALQADVDTVEWLAEHLRAGPKRALALSDAAQRASITRNALLAAALLLNVKVSGNAPHQRWHLPETRA